MISSDVIFGTLNSREDLNLTFTHADKGSPDVHTEYVEVPGRPPVDLSELAGRVQYNNRKMVIEFEYTGFDWEAEKQLVLAKLHGRKMQIRFLNDPDWYYTGRCTVKSKINGSTIHFTVDVTADPYKRMYNEPVEDLYVEGDVPAEFTITNPTDFPSKPRIRVSGTGDGTLTVGNKTITLTDIDEYIVIDSMLMDCYKGTLNQNAKVALAEFPMFKPGVNNLAYTGDITGLEVLGRWWTL